MANPKHLALLRSGVQSWNAWRREHPWWIPRLNGAVLDGLDLQNVDFTGALMRRASLRGARLDGSLMCYYNFPPDRPGWAVPDFTGVDLSDASLRGVDFEHADLTGASLRRANLTDARFIESYLEDTIFDGAVLTRCSFIWSFLANTSFGNVDLSEAQDLNTVVHQAPSSLGIETIFRSKGKIPEDFLRGVGLPDHIIQAIPTLAHPGNPKYRRCFISYSHKDEVFAKHLHAALQAEGVRCWLDEHDLLPGEEILRAIHRGIQRGDRVLLCCSETSLRSWWVQREIDFVLDKERLLQGKRRTNPRLLIPLALDDSLFSSDPLATVLRQRSAADFRDWMIDGSIFAKAFNRLLRSLSGNPRAAGSREG